MISATEKKQPSGVVGITNHKNGVHRMQSMLLSRNEKYEQGILPKHLECPICKNILKDAVLLRWDPEGTSTCESCIRSELLRSGFRCPVTGMDGASPDDLIPNQALRKAVSTFFMNTKHTKESAASRLGHLKKDFEENEKKRRNTSNKAPTKTNHPNKTMVAQKVALAAEGTTKTNVVQSNKFDDEDHVVASPCQLGYTGSKNDDYSFLVIDDDTSFIVFDTNKTVNRSSFKRNNKDKTMADDILDDTSTFGSDVFH